MIPMRAHFEAELNSLRETMLEMATCADNMLAQAVEALMSGNLELVQKVIAQDDTVDRYDIEIENKCLRLIATQQPVARDLRTIGTALKAITDVERIGDYAVDIAKIGRRLARAQQIYRPLVDIPRLAYLSRVMLQDALQAFIHHDLNLVEKVIRDDDEVDRLYHAMRERLTQEIVEHPSCALLALNIMFAAKYLERVSDHVVNIAERVWFVETGELKPAREFLNEEDSP